MKKERTPAQKLGYYKKVCAELWHKSPMYWEAYNRAKVRPGILKCALCGVEGDSRLYEIDHIEPKAAPGQDPMDISLWAARLNCRAEGLQALCDSCHGKKTGKENSKRVKREAGNVR